MTSREEALGSDYLLSKTPWLRSSLVPLFTLIFARIFQFNNKNNRKAPSPGRRLKRKMKPREKKKADNIGKKRPVAEIIWYPSTSLCPCNEAAHYDWSIISCVSLLMCIAWWYSGGWMAPHTPLRRSRSSASYLDAENNESDELPPPPPLSRSSRDTQAVVASS